MQSRLGPLRGILFTTTLFLAPLLAGCVAVIDSPMPNPGLEVYGNTEPDDARQTSVVGFRMLALHEELVPDVILHLVEPGSFSTPLDQAFADVSISEEQQLLISIPPSSHATQRFHIWAGATLPVGPRMGKTNTDHVILIGQPNSTTLYRLAVTEKNIAVHKLDLNLVRTQLSEARSAKAEEGSVPDKSPYTTALEKKRFWKRIPWVPTDDIRGDFQEYTNNTIKLGLKFSNTPG